MNSILMTVFGLLGGLAIFLFGMNSMSEALQKAAGEKMRKILAFLTKNPVMGALAGALVTAVLQSSSATTVMTIGFVSAGLMGLPQAISVIFGANIGTTMTAQLIAFKISDYIYPIIFIGFLVNFLGKKERVKDIGQVIFSFGLLFEGIEIMSSVMKPLAQSAVFTDLMGRVKDVPFLGILLGMCMTLLVQSSSATIAVLQSFASTAVAGTTTSVIGLTGAIPILLGDNIGTTITAILASIGQNRNAKRTAAAHAIFNITGTILFSFFIPQFAAFITWISPKGDGVAVISRQIANAHTTFNVVCTLIWLPLLGFMVKIVTVLIPDAKTKGGEEKIPALDARIAAQPAAAMVLISDEIAKLSERTKELFSQVLRQLSKDQAGTEAEGVGTYQQFYTDYNEAKAVLKNLMDTISMMFARGSLSQEQSAEASGLLSVVDDIDRILDRCRDIVTDAAKVHAGGRKFSGEAAEEIADCVGAAQKMYAQAFGMVSGEKIDDPEEIRKAKNRLRKSIRRFNKAHLKRIQEKKCDQALTGVFGDILYNVDRIGDNCVSIAEEALDGTALSLRADIQAAEVRTEEMRE